MKKQWLILIGIILVIMVIFIVFKPNDKEEDNNVGLSQISLNGFTLGSDVPDNISDYLLMDDMNYSYIYNNIHISTDSNNKIDALGFFTSVYADDTVIAGINDIKIMYNGNILKTVDDFKTYFGEGTKEGNYIKYSDDSTELVITLKNNDIYNIELTKKQ